MSGVSRERGDVILLNKARKKGAVINTSSYEESRERKLQILADEEDYLSKYYLGKLKEERGDIEGAMRLYLDSLRVSTVAAKDLGDLISRYPKEYRMVSSNKR